MPEKRYIPKADIVWLFNGSGSEGYCVIKKPEVNRADRKRTLIREGCHVYPDGNWFYFKLLEPEDYETWKMNGDWHDELNHDPDRVATARLQKGVLPPHFQERDDNNWGDLNPRIVPDYVTDITLGHLKMAHRQLSIEVREGKKVQHA